ncbi:unnamed protein product [Ixodes persulcatus]
MNVYAVSRLVVVAMFGIRAVEARRFLTILYEHNQIGLNHVDQ